MYPPDSIWWILWFRFVTPTLLPQCVERFHCYHSNEKNIIASLLKFAGYIHNHKILPGNIFGLILKNKMAATGIFMIPQYKILTGNIFGLILKNKMAAMGVSLSVMKIAYISLIIGPRGLVCEANL